MQTARQHITRSGLHPLTRRHVRRVGRDGGTVESLQGLDRMYRRLRRVGRYDDLTCGFDYRFGVRTNGLSVDKVYDYGPNENDAVQTTGSQQPVYGDGLLFDDSDDALIAPTDSLSNDSMTLLAVIRDRGADADRHAIVNADEATNAYQYLHFGTWQDGGGTHAMLGDGSSYDELGGGNHLGNVRQFRSAVLGSGSQTVYANGQEVAVDTIALQTTFTGLNIGGANYRHGYLAQYALQVFSVTLSDAARTSLEGLLMHEHSVA